MLEKEIEAKLKKGVEDIGGLCLKWVSPGYVGVPDRIIILPGGTIYFVELKAPGKKERVRQQYVQQRIRRMGFIVYASVDSLAFVDAIIDDCREAIKANEKRI